MNLRNLLSPTLPSTLVIGALSATLIFTAGCSSDSKTTSGSGSGSSSAGSGSSSSSKNKNDDPMADTQRTIAQLDRDYVVGPTAAAELGMRVAWQFQGVRGATLKVKGMAIRGDSAYTLDQDNFLTRVGLSDGQKRWRFQVADPVLDVVSLNVLEDTIFLTAGSLMLTFDANSGSQLAKWKLDKVAGTHPVEHGNELIYGATGGDVVWLSRKLGFLTRADHVSPTIHVPLVLKGDILAVVGVQGEIMVLNAKTATQYWSKMLLSPVVSRPVIGDGMLYVAATDQYLWAFDIRNGRSDWKVLTDAPLTTSPTLIGERLYQQIPGSGLACFNANPVDLPGGERFWTNDKVAGVVVYERRGDLYCWDLPTKRMMVLDAARGLTKTKLDLTQVDYLFLAGEKGEDIIVANRDGRIVKLSPRT